MDLVKNFFIARTATAGKVRMDPHFITTGHKEFFIDSIGKLRIAEWEMFFLEYLRDAFLDAIVWSCHMTQKAAKGAQKSTINTDSRRKRRKTRKSTNSAWSVSGTIEVLLSAIKKNSLSISNHAIYLKADIWQIWAVLEYLKYEHRFCELLSIKTELKRLKIRFESALRILTFRKRQVSSVYAVKCPAHFRKKHFSIFKYR